MVALEVDGGLEVEDCSALEGIVKPEGMEAEVDGSGTGFVSASFPAWVFKSN